MTEPYSSLPQPSAFRPVTSAAAEPAAGLALAMFERIGRDHALTLDELTRDAASDIGGASAAWDVLGSMWAAYERHWRRFCGSRLDPQF
ncbi:MAG: hypothetical protein AB7O32_05700, partial [Vicinamibacterales bacterium]